MKTLVIFNDGTSIFPLYLVSDTDEWDKFDGLVINACDNEPNLEEEITKKLYDENGVLKFEFKSEFPLGVVFDKVVNIAFLP